MKSQKTNFEAVINQLNKKDSEITKVFTKTSKINISDEERIAIWDRTSVISSKNSANFRIDVAGALIKLSDYNVKNSPFGWTIQPVNLFKLPINYNINDLIAIHWMNAENRFETLQENNNFTAVITRVKDPLISKNIYQEQVIIGNEIKTQNKSTLWTKKEKQKQKK